MSIFQLLEAIGIKAILFIAGFCGGLAKLGKHNKLSFWQRFISVLSGGFSANYITPLVCDMFNLKEQTMYGVAFIVGYGGLIFVEFIYTKITTKKLEDEL